MSLTVTTSKRISPAPAHDRWCAIGHSGVQMDADKKVEILASLLAEASETIADPWAEIGRALAADRSALLAHTPACAANISDFGTMLAWTVLCRRWAGEAARYLVLCDDPWMFRHLASIEGVRTGPPPPLIAAEFKLAWRGFAARSLAALRLGWAAIRLAPQKRRCPVKRNAILVYAHPSSSAAGEDGYFGDLMIRFPQIIRLLHVDCPLGRARELCADPRSFSLHAWGDPLAALALPFAKWRPPARDCSGRNGWLVRRAAALEGGTGQAAMIRWQQICQANWLSKSAPLGIVWPWENHSWERDLVRRAREFGVNTTGYQHSTVGATELNYRPDSNGDGMASIPKRIFTSGPAALERLLAMGLPGDRLTIGGAWRSRAGQAPGYDPDGPVFVALPSDQVIAAEMVSAIRAAGQDGKCFLVKDHPMTPFAFEESPGVQRAHAPLSAQKPLSAVIYSSTTVGLEALIDGLPTFQFLSESKIPLDVLPEGITVPSVSAATVAKCLASAETPPKLDRLSVFSVPDMDIWNSALSDTAP